MNQKVPISGKINMGRSIAAGGLKLTPMMLVANLVNTKMLPTTWKITESLQIGTHLRLLSKRYPMNTNMTRLKVFSDEFKKSLHPWPLDESSLSIVTPPPPPPPTSKNPSGSEPVGCMVFMKTPKHLKYHTSSNTISDSIWKCRFQATGYFYLAQCNFQNTVLQYMSKYMVVIDR